MNPIFHIITRISINEPLIDDFLYGDYADRPYPETTFAKCVDNSTVAFSKNTARFPKIIGPFNLTVPTDLMLDLRDRITAKWRRVEFTELFELRWDSDGFSIVEEYEKACRNELVAAGITNSYEQDDRISLDEGLIYLDMIKRHRTDRLPIDFTYWELIANHCTRVANEPDSSEILIISKTESTIRRASAEISFQSLDTDFRPLSPKSLKEHGILSLYSRTFAVDDRIMRYFDPWIESEHYSIRSIYENDIIG